MLNIIIFIFSIPVFIVSLFLFIFTKDEKEEFQAELLEEIAQEKKIKEFWGGKNE